ncbi:MAG: recombination protein RecR [Pseudomonadales bacterium]|nr:recombination protein RecR [Pseudomonadales bacterium]
MKNSTIIDQLVEAFCCLPGVGPKTAQRMVLYLLERDREGGRRLSARLQEAMERVGHCRACRNLTELETCEISANPARDGTTICVVDTPADVLAIEQSGDYRGQYFVLMGNLSPIDGIGPDEIGVDQLLKRCEREVNEVILALDSTVEGEATAHYISEAVKRMDVAVSRIAQGIPLGGELEYVDASTLSHALAGRKRL